MALIEGLEGPGKPLLHTSGSRVIADNAHDDYASNQIFEDNSPFIPAPNRAHRAAIDQILRDPFSRLMQHDLYGIGKGLHRESVQVPLQSRKLGKAVPSDAWGVVPMPVP
jgi:hypothetical protein